MALLELRQVSKAFGGPSGVVRAVEGVTLTVGAGEFVVIRGPSGCGKTTLLLMAGGLLAPDAGTVSVDGENPYGLAAERRAQLRAERIGFVFQQFHLVPYLSVLDNILVASLGLGRRDGRQRAEQLAARFGLTERLHHVPAQLSTGERQRTALARALFNEPKLLLADEPTGNLDEANGEVVIGYLAEFARGGGAVLLVTHDARATVLATRVLRMSNGKLED